MRVYFVRHALACLILVAGLVGLTPSRGLAQSAPWIPDQSGLVILVRTTIIALNHANRTGNYAVFRALGSPDFQKTNSPADLAAIFTKLRGQNLDLGPIVLFNPTFSKRPLLNSQKMLRLTGFFPTNPLSLQFDLLYQWLDERWQLFGIAVQTK